MRIGYFVIKYPYDQNYDNYLFGGSTVAAYNLALKMARRDHDVQIFTTSHNTRDSVVLKDNLTIYRFGTTFRLYTSSISLSMLLHIQKREVDIAHVHFDIPPNPFIGLNYAKKKKIPLILTYHGDWVSNYGGTFRTYATQFFNRYLVDKILEQSTVIISPSRHYIQESKFLKQYSHKVVCIPNGVNIEDFDITYSKEECRSITGLPQDRRILVFMGLLGPHKGPEFLIKALRSIIRKHSDILLVFMGTGIQVNELKHLTHQLGLDEHIVFLGYISDKNFKAMVLKAADIFCLPSLYECFPLVILEAMASGLPVVASNISGIPELIVHGKNGLLCQPGDSSELKEAINYLLENDNVRTEMGILNKIVIKNYSWDAIALKTENLYSDISESFHGS
jgi:glycosyltransferase involved in cell wall biosynthesis